MTADFDCDLYGGDCGNSSLGELCDNNWDPSDGIKVGSDDVEVAIATTTNRGLA